MMPYTKQGSKQTLLLLGWLQWDPCGNKIAKQNVNILETQWLQVSMMVVFTNLIRSVVSTRLAKILMILLFNVRAHQNKLGMSCAKLRTAWARTTSLELSISWGCLLSPLWLELEAWGNCRLEYTIGLRVGWNSLSKLPYSKELAPY